MHTHASMGIHTHPLRKLLRVSIYRMLHKCSRSMYHLDTTGQPSQCHLQTIPAHHHTPIQCLLPLKTWIRHFTVLLHILKSMYTPPRLSHRRRRYTTIAPSLLRFPMLPASFPPRLSHNPLQKATHPHRVPSPPGHPFSPQNPFLLDSSPLILKLNSSRSPSREYKNTMADWTWVLLPSPSSSGSIHIDGTPWTTYSCRASARGQSRNQCFLCGSYDAVPCS
jgi:hypothetical protein